MAACSWFFDVVDPNNLLLGFTAHNSMYCTDCCACRASGNAFPVTAVLCSDPVLQELVRKWTKTAVDQTRMNENLSTAFL
jgi:hypothetical protein